MLTCQYNECRQEEQWAQHVGGNQSPDKDLKEKKTQLDVCDWTESSTNIKW